MNLDDNVIVASLAKVRDEEVEQESENFRRRNRIKIKSQSMASAVCALTSRITE